MATLNAAADELLLMQNKMIVFFNPNFLELLNNQFRLSSVPSHCAQVSLLGLPGSL
jgi:hypothetical protein